MQPAHILSSRALTRGEGRRDHAKLLHKNMAVAHAQHMLRTTAAKFLEDTMVVHLLSSALLHCTILIESTGKA